MIESKETKTGDVITGRWINPTTALIALSGLLMLATLALVFLWVPTDSELGIRQRIVYFHVPVAWVSFLAFFVVFIASIGFLRRGKESWDTLAYVAAEVGVLFASLMLVTGVIFGKATWWDNTGRWWDWTPTLTTALILWFIYVAYLMLRAYAPKGAQGSRYAAVLGIIGFADVPIVYMAAKWWGDLHPSENRVPAGGFEDSAMLITLMVSLVTFTVLFIYLLVQRYQLRQAEDSIERMIQTYE